ncbi:MAG: envelope stress response membrane protein PspB [Gammaproteobacteria bacterium]|nr:envelope stress response membrane protein PspB [Gammaproteobacteria bacterium]TVQ45568.1 MAG: envelope stress response membrane protein PspB [Gammaproteobacteria bacterium]
MNGMIFPLLVILLTVVVPLALLLHYITRWRESKGLSAEDEQMLEDLWQDAKRMESRVNALETILDDEVPDWRKRV